MTRLPPRVLQGAGVGSAFWAYRGLPRCRMVRLVGLRRALPGLARRRADLRGCHPVRGDQPKPICGTLLNFSGGTSTCHPGRTRTRCDPLPDAARPALEDTARPGSRLLGGRDRVVGVAAACLGGRGPCEHGPRTARRPGRTKLRCRRRHPSRPHRCGGRPSIDMLLARPLRPPTLAGPWPRFEATSLEILFRPRGFAPPRRVPPRAELRACCIPLPILGFAAFPGRPCHCRSRDSGADLSRSAFHTPRRRLPGGSRTASPQPLPSCRWLVVLVGARRGPVTRIVAVRRLTRSRRLQGLAPLPGL
jgi:hypothetical protein